MPVTFNTKATVPSNPAPYLHEDKIDAATAAHAVYTAKYLARSRANDELKAANKVMLDQSKSQEERDAAQELSRAALRRAYS